LWVAKIEANGDPVTLLRPKLKVEYSKGPIFITKTVYLTEQKTRTVDGRDEVYTVEVPYTVREEKYPAMSIPDGVDRYTIPISKIKGWYIDGIVLTPEILAKELKTPKHVFVSEFLHDDFAGLDPYFRSVFQSQVIFLCIPSGTQSDAEYQKSSSKK